MTDLTKLNKEPLLEEALKQREELEKLRAEIDKQKQANRELAKRGEGWLVTAPNPVFNGKRYGIQFTDGCAFILKDRDVEAFKVEPMGKGEMRRFIQNQYPAKYFSKEDRARAEAEIEERQKVTSAERAVEAFENDLGYKVEYFSADRLSEVQQRMTQRARERQAAEAAMVQEKNAHLVGG